jgi:hypothetical protein
MLRARTFGWSTAALLALGAVRPLAAQTAADSAKAKVPVTQPAAPAPTGVTVSGLLFGSYNFTPSTTPNPNTNQIDNAFILDRAYLNFRAPAGDRMSVRITTDVYQTSESTPNAYTIRAKYAYLQYDAPKFSNGASLFGRLGIIQNVMTEHSESFWPRYLSQTPVERAGYFSSADVGIGSQLNFPNKMGEIYATIVNGPGYTSRERDRFKDYAARLSLTPLANDASSPLLQTFTITGWAYKGATASAFVNGGANQVGSVGSALDRTRYGALVGIKDPRLTIAGEWATRRDESEIGQNTVASPRVVTEAQGNLLSGYTVIRPFAFTNGTGKSPFGIVARYDRVKPTASTTNFVTPPSTDNAYHTLIGGVFYDVNARSTFALDYQESLASNNDLSAAPPAQSKGYFMHFQVNF